MILENGRFHTLDPALPSVAALPITRDGIVAKGVEAWEGEASAVTPERVDLQGCTVVPGLVDAHVHLLSWALARDAVELGACTSARACAAAAAEALRAGAAARAPGGLLVGRGFRVDAFADGAAPHRDLLDAAVGDAPVALWAHDDHTVWLSSAALRQLAVDPADAPDGIVREHAAWRLPFPRPTRDEQLGALARAIREALARGITTIHDFDGAGAFSLFQELDGSRALRLRVLSAIRAEQLEAALATGLRSGFGSDLLRVGPVKAFMDGALGSRTAWMLEPYDDGAGSGEPLLDQAGLEQLVRAASAGGLRVAVHAIGDAAGRAALDALEATRRAWAPQELWPRLEHAQLLHPDDLPRLGALGVVASVQPTHQTTDRDAADRAWGERTRGAYAWRSLAASGAVLAFGSDAPIEPLDPLAALHAAVNRTLDERPAWRPEEAVDVATALRALTSGPAHAAGWERIGTLGPGRAADLVVLDGDPFTCDPARLRELRVVATMVAGRFVHGRDALIR